MPSQRFINGVIQDFKHHVVQSRTVLRVADIHTRPFANRFQAFQNGNAGRIVIISTLILLRILSVSHFDFFLLKNLLIIAYLSLSGSLKNSE